VAQQVTSNQNNITCHAHFVVQQVTSNQNNNATKLIIFSTVKRLIYLIPLIAQFFKIAH